MRYDEFLARVRDLGEYGDRQEAREVADAVLSVLATRLTPDEVEDLAEQVPGRLRDVLQENRVDQPGTFGVEEFCRRVGERTGARPRTAEWDASAVLATLAETVSGGELDQVLDQLPSGYADLFGKPEPSG
ncbi:DUF2267 domain-containing protein [Streptomyces sp. TRM43335]|uniref:DUF2267 domain-containing protein n=1 Tax=Streptomyces taklimakanensis TaxID=2569853 RepID=A0A6G2BGM0_9ACTN|nr:DUF2267 domain-containing protein [Streptomyces taklimakanensis]MTE21425.1 DUF2267 domain-containing protein [Streptomyces taklimakanensis]